MKKPPSDFDYYDDAQNLPVLVKLVAFIFLCAFILGLYRAMPHAQLNINGDGLQWVISPCGDYLHEDLPAAAPLVDVQVSVE